MGFSRAFLSKKVLHFENLRFGNEEGMGIILTLPDSVLSPISLAPSLLFTAE